MIQKTSFLHHPLETILGPWLSYVTWTLFIISCIGIVAIAYYIYLASRPSETNEAAIKEAEQEQKKAENEIVTGGVRIWEYLSLLGYWPLDEMVRSFIKSLDILRAEFGGTGYRYRLPWYLLIGAEGSGKTTLMDELDLVRPLGTPMEPNVGENPGVLWSFFSQGVILDVQGDYFLAPQAPVSIKNKWVRLFSLLAHFRVERPIDGVILTIPMTELVGDEKLSDEVLNQRANYINENLSLIEKRLGMKVPVYVVFTKCDKITGFKEFSRSLTPALQKEIFGWSSPYSPGMRLQPGWIDQAYGTLRDALREAQIEIFSGPVEEENRDGIILFPEYFENLKEKIAFYLGGIFQERGYRESYFFRGLYFTGDISWQPQESTNVYASCKPTQPLASYGMDNPRKIIFSSQLIEDKVFPEDILAVPGRRRILASSRAINVVRMLMVGIALCFMLLFVHDYRRISGEFEYLTPILNKIAKNLENAPKNKFGAADQFERLFYDNETKELITSLSGLKNRNFWSLVFPPSWTGSVQRQFNKALRITLNSIILKAIHSELLYRLIRIIDDPLPYIESNIEKLTLLNPLETMEFLVLNGYVNALVELTNYIDKYKKLEETKNLKDLEEIITFLFDIHFQKDLADLEVAYQNSFSFVQDNPIPLDAYVLRAQKRLMHLFDQFVEATTGVTGGYNELVGLASQLTALGQTKDGILPMRVDVDQLLARINEDIATLSDPGLAWVNHPYFGPGDAYTLLMGNIYSFPLFGPDLANKLSHQAAQAYSGFKERLKNLRSDTTGPLFAEESGNLVAAPSLGLLSMQKALSEFVNLSFIKDWKGSEQIAQIPVGTRLYWNKSLLTQAINIVGQMNIFLKQELPTYPASIQEIFLEIAKIATQQSVNSIISQAQTFVAESSFMAEYSYESDVRNQLENLTGVLPSFLTLLNILNDTHLTDSQMAVRDIIGRQISDVLTEVSEFFESEGFYEPNSFTFSDWQGGADAAYLAFGVSDKASLLAYLNLERERIIYLVQQEALPLLNFVASPEFKLQPEKVGLITHWQLLIEAVNGYLRKKPHNAIQALEKFIKEDMNAVTLENYNEKLNPDRFDSGSGFFLTRLDQLRSGLYARCQQLSGKQALNHYDGLQMWFNRKLAHRFPFVGTHPELEVGSADPQDIKAFFELYDATAKDARAYLKQLMDKGINVSDALEFMLAMEDVRLFFSGFILNKAPNSLPSYDFKIEFRVNKESEKGANELINWIFTMGGGEKFDLYSTSREGVWQYGAPVNMTFRWASNGPNAPAMDGQQTDLTVNGFEATYGYAEPWALLKLMMKHNASLSAFKDRVDPQPQTLFFEVPTRNLLNTNMPHGESARLFVRISLQNPKKEGGQTVLVPFFPEVAPLLPQTTPNGR